MSFWIPNQNTPNKTISIALHIFNDDNGNGTIFHNNPSGISEVNQMMDWLNGWFSANGTPTNPFPNVIDLESTLISFDLPQHEIYFYENTNLSNCSSGSQINFIQNNYPERLKSLPVIIAPQNCGPHASLPFPNWVGTGGATTGSLFGNSYAFLGPSSTWTAAQTLAHELGHCLDLLHTYEPSCCHETCNQNNQDFLLDVFDTNLGGNCWHDGGFSCDINNPNTTCTNNLMGGVNQSSFYLSPLQIGKIHRALSIKSVRKYIKDSP
ncbi:MAG: hypothetical protein JJT77_14010, partial [Crocinitomicaceae bacterium]|nr:hypothetical protein [Crocinitomicaceae bacterium]